ncbi:MAG: prolipoprotein diacylglyceryl transferase, partial [Planctomycetes bacterium]|nr:prolipoprotein diacylglyceryl transferase [Planctomycetota bacterium]
WEGGIHFFEKPPANVDSTIILGAYYFAYFLVFLVGWIAFRRWVAKGKVGISKREITDLGIYVLLGVMLGAKLVYVLFYNLEFYLQNPSQIFLNWSGMASHGAFLGVTVAILLFARSFKRNALELFDRCALIAPFGAIFIRSANFLNGELYGRSTDVDNPLAMRFLMKDGQGRDLYAKLGPGQSGGLQAAGDNAGQAGSELYALVTHEGGEELAPADYYLEPVSAHHGWELIPEESFLSVKSFWPIRQDGETAKTKTLVSRVVTDPSHPSQLYQLGVSGVLLLLVMVIVAKRAKVKGEIFAWFLMLYGVSRIAMEFFRQQDYQRAGGLFDYFSMGQILSLALIVSGLFLLKRLKPNSAPTTPPSEQEAEPTSNTEGE